MKFIKLDIDECYAYLVASSDNLAVIIDPKLDYADYYLNLLEEKNLKLTMVIDTHSHADHLSGATYLKEKTGATYAMHESSNSVSVDRKLVDNEEFTVGDLHFKVLTTPGHTSNSVSIICEDKFFTGDFLFLDGSGRDDLPSGDYAQHFESVKKIQSLPDHLIICPGHNYGQQGLSSLYQIKKENPVLSCKTLEEFIEQTKPDVAPEMWMGDLVKLNNSGNTSMDAFEIPKTKSVCQKGASANMALDNITYVTPSEVDKMLDNPNPPLLIDVRNPDEFDDLKPINNIINIPITELPKRINELSVHEGKTFITICKGGPRATRAAKMIQKLNIGKVFVLKGGMLGYRNQ
ncbi:MAG: MBL fold metallo-hydrolase [Sarcina sp.]